MMKPGLKGVIAAETKIGEVDGLNGRLVYRGYEIRELTKERTFEEVAYLLWYGKIPEQEELLRFHRLFHQSRQLTPVMMNVLDALPDNMDMMSVLRTVLSAEGDSTYGWKPTLDQAVALTAKIPTIIASRKNTLEGRPLIDPDNNLSHVENYLYMLHGSLPKAEHVRALETYMILTMEHGMNASTFSARVTASTESDLVSAICAAIGTMKGPLHGGAPSEVIALLDEVKQEQNVRSFLSQKILAGEKLMGFGHRVYKTHDPRALALKEKLMEQEGKDEWLDLALSVEVAAIAALEEHKPGRALYTNVEFYAAAIMKAIELDPSLFTPTFTASRMVGWTAHVLEQAENNTIFRPLSRYIGK
ncbi:citrate synthase/methylcitrate synthase [Bacillus tianshenii]|uniref:citrate synthase/methylcitrate synthase n=1 Tax=Sutcliffiella tianshenii TaxID=1463404 RepID=UPI001CD73812|nr:citrate synthase/methylcitrate synthase [Bacillus tianshenii]MCA1319478.1 citrate synthase/methylcitrate synthase [Bacillus tianshenii]